MRSVQDYQKYYLYTKIVVRCITTPGQTHEVCTRPITSTSILTFVFYLQVRLLMFKTRSEQRISEDFPKKIVHVIATPQLSKTLMRID